MKKNTFHIVTLGCAKNSVDSDAMGQLLTGLGYQQAATPQRARVIIVNTCGFIEQARDESYDTLAELAAAKKSSQVVIAAGCLSQRYGAEVAEKIPGIDGIIGTRRWTDIGEVLRKLESGSAAGPYCHLPPADTVAHGDGIHQVSLQGPSAYLKIADGCRRSCAFCAIPAIKGPNVSRPVDAILADARYLQEQGVREIVLIAQDTTGYGSDLGMDNGLAHLVEAMAAAVPNVDWLRIMYTFPGAVTDELIAVMAGCRQVVPYLDLPLQHAHPATLRRMHRPSDIDQVRETLAKMRTAIPGLALRTTFIVGYPGETEEEFQSLLDFAEELRFDKLGAFTYSFEKGTPAEHLGDPVSPEEKEERLGRLMELQQRISLESNKALVGTTLDVLIEGNAEGISVGRSYRDAPEIDGLVLVSGIVPPGSLIPVEIRGASVYDLSGVPVTEAVTE